MKVKVFKCDVNDDLSIAKFEKDVSQFLNQISQEATLQGCIIAPLILSTTSSNGLLTHIIHYNYQRLTPAGKILT